jgi:hypothetical protein
MITLSKGYKKPQTGDFGEVWFPALEDNIELMNSHSHNGVDGEQIDTTDLIVIKLTVLSASFADQGDGYFRATVTLPGSTLVDNHAFTFKDPTTKEELHLRHEKFAANQLYIYTNIVQDVEVYIGS